MLHAERLAISHPRTHEPLEFVAPLPPDFIDTISRLKALQDR
jgi:hypothetical protein